MLVLMENEAFFFVWSHKIANKFIENQFGFYPAAQATRNLFSVIWILLAKYLPFYMKIIAKISILAVRRAYERNIPFTKSNF